MPWRATRAAVLGVAVVAMAVTIVPVPAAGESSGTAPVPPGNTGCPKNGSPGTTTLTLSIGGRTRTVIVHAPSAYDPARPTPLVLNLHGSGSTALQQEQFTGMDATADSDTFLVAYPQAVISDRSGFDWNVPNQPLIGGAAVPAHAANDVAFLTQLVPVLAKRYCIEAARVYVTGFSGGARLSSQLGCAAVNTFAAVAPVSGLRLPTPCKASRPMPVISFHGTADPVDPYDGNGQKYWTYSVPAAARKWAAHDRCGATPAMSEPDPGATVTAYAGCSQGTTVELYTIAGEGHEWPGGPHLPKSITAELGPQSNAVDANALIWSFFSTHPRR